MECNSCGSLAPESAKFCNGCGKDLNLEVGTGAGAVELLQQALPSKTKDCPFCAETIDNQLAECPHCGSPLVGTKIEQKTSKTTVSPRGSNHALTVVQDSKHCTNCAQVVDPSAIACLSCGAAPKLHRKFCYGCGSQIKQEQIICVNCGIGVPRTSHLSAPIEKEGDGKCFCTNCGTNVSPKTVACTKCGAAPRNHKNFCYCCGVPVQPEQVVCLKCGVGLSARGPGSSRKSKTTAGILAILLGGIGIHKFYLGCWGWGIVNILTCWTYIPSLFGLVQGIHFLIMDEAKFDAKWNSLPVHPFTSPW
jgi:TM2 domain-containing membrane protein YozV